VVNAGLVRPSEFCGTAPELLKGSTRRMLKLVSNGEKPADKDRKEADGLLLSFETKKIK